MLRSITPIPARRSPRKSNAGRQASGVDVLESVGGPEVRPLLGLRSASFLRAWMVVLPVDAVALCAPAVWAPGHAKGSLAMAALSMLLLTGGGRYRARLHISVLDELPILTSRLLVAAAVVATVFAVRHEQDETAAFLETALAAIGMVILGRILTSQLILLGRKRRIIAHRTVIVSDGVQGAELAVLLHRYPQYGLYPVGFVDDQYGLPGGDKERILGRVTDLDRVLEEVRAGVVIIAGDDLTDRQLREVLRRPTFAKKDLMVVPRLHSFCQSNGTVDHIGAIPIVRIRLPAMSGPALAVKRAVDVLASVSTLILLAPLLLVCALAVRLEGGPGILFSQERVGRDNQRFTCLKFRSMRPASNTEAATRWSIADDERVKPVGRLLRRTGLDELPQLWNILRGDMTLVGPRPERPAFVDQFCEEFPDYGSRHRVRSGLTGLAQVSGLRGDVPIADRARFDNYYIENWSLWLDVKVLLRTTTEVLFARGR